MPKRVNDPIDLTLGQRVAELREYRGMTQEQLANALGLSVGPIQHIEHGRNHITFLRLLQIARALRVEPTDLTQPPGSPMPRFFCHSATQLQAAVDLMGLGRYSWNPQTNVLTWDARLKAIWGLPPDIKPDYEIWYNGIHRNDVNRVDAAVARCKDPRQDGVYDVKYRVLGLDGVERWVHTRGRTYFENDQPIDFAGVLLDITPKRDHHAV